MSHGSTTFKERSPCVHHWATLCWGRREEEQWRGGPAFPVVRRGSGVKAWKKMEGEGGACGERGNDSGPSATSPSALWHQPSWSWASGTYRDQGEGTSCHLIHTACLSLFDRELLFCIFLTYQKQLFEFRVGSLDVLQGQEVAWQVFSFNNFIGWPVDGLIDSRYQKVTGD